MWERLWTYCCVDVNGREARIEDLDDAHVLVHEGEWDQRIIGIWIRERGAGRPDQMSNIKKVIKR